MHRETHLCVRFPKHYEMLFCQFHPVPKRPQETWVVNVLYFVSNNQNIFVLLTSSNIKWDPNKICPL
jgi:hypothetical protein